MEPSSVLSEVKRPYGLHHWEDHHGNHGVEVLSQQPVTLRTIWANGLFKSSNEKPGICLSDYFHPAGDAKRRIFAVVDRCLPEDKRKEIDAYFAWCKTEELLEDYKIMTFAADKAEKGLGMVTAVLRTAKHFGIRRRDLYVAIGGKTLTDIVGFAAAICRRSVPYILVSTDIVGIINGHTINTKVSIDHVACDSKVYKGLFALSHLPIVRFNDLAFLDFVNEIDIRCGLTEIIMIAMLKDNVLFSYLELHMEGILAGTGGHLVTVVRRAAAATLDEPRKANFGHEARRAIEQIKGIAYNEANSMALAVALMSALSFVKGMLSNAALGCVLSVLEKARLPIHDEALEADALWDFLKDSIQEGACVIPVDVGRAGFLNAASISLEDIAAALAVLCKSCPARFDTSPWVALDLSAVHVTDASSAFHERIFSEDVQYHVASVQGIFLHDNHTIRDYCAKSSDGYKKKILIVVDEYVGNTITVIREYMTSHSSTIGELSVLSMHVSSKCKNIKSTLSVIDAAIRLKMSKRDLLIVVGGGTLMDIVGFAAAIYKGGIPYLKIPTTLLGMIDAGIAVKVGVNLEGHKNFIGRYYAPIACLNDPAAFLDTLPQRELACGLAEAIKMAVIKSPRLFEMIETYHGNVKYASHTHELIQVAVYSMLEELQPNLYELSLRRLVDFGHEFGHIVESLADYNIPHGECVAIGMAIAAFLAYLKGVSSQKTLERILNLILDIGLPIFVTDHDCCNPKELWARICGEGIEQKHGMLYLVVPESIGQATFLNNISDIDAAMLNESVLGLKQYADSYARKCSPRTTTFDEATVTATSKNLISENGKAFYTNGIHSPRTTAAVLGASGDIGSQIADYLVCNDMQVICSIRSSSLDKFNGRMKNTDLTSMRVLVGDLLDLANLREVITKADIIYNMAGIVTLSSKPDEFAKVLALNGFAQEMIAHLIRHLGRENHVRFIYPSSQRVHLTTADGSVDAWIRAAAETFSTLKESLFSEPDVLTALEIFVAQFMATHPLPTGHNVYELSKRLGEHFVSSLPHHSCIRISDVYGPAFTSGFVHRAINAKSEGNNEKQEKREKRDFIFIDDVNELLLKAAQTETVDSKAFDGATGERINLEEVWRIVRELVGDPAIVSFENGMAVQEVNLDPAFARNLLGREFIPLRLGLRKTISRSLRNCRESKQDNHCQETETSRPAPNEALASEPTLNFVRSGNKFQVHTGASFISELIGQALDRWFERLTPRQQAVLMENMNTKAGLFIRLPEDAAMKQSSEFTVEADEQHNYQGIIDIHTYLILDTGTQERLDDAIGCQGHRLLAFLLRGRKPLLSNREVEREKAMAHNWQDFLAYPRKHHIIVLDVGATFLRIGILSSNCLLLAEPTRLSTPSKLSYPMDTLVELQERLIEALVCGINTVRTSHSDLSLEEVGISFGAVISRAGIVEDASVLWGDASRHFNLMNALQERLSGVRLTIMNDVSAAAWRYKDEGRFCLITVSSGLSNKVFNADLRTLDKLDLDDVGVGGEMGHVVVQPRAVDELVRHSREQVIARPEDFRSSQLYAHVEGDVQKINARVLGMAAREHDGFVLGLLEEADVPYCACGNLADLCSYSSGRGALRLAQRLAVRGSYDVASCEITDQWLQIAIVTRHPLALKVLHESTYPLALRILQLAADIGLNRFIIVGGFAMKTAKGAYLLALQDHLVRFCHDSGFFAGWQENQIRGLVEYGVGDDNDGLIGVGLLVQHLRAQYLAVEKPVGELALALVTRSIPRCGAREMLVKVIYSGICTTDLQIHRRERGYEPVILGHEGVCQVIEVGKDVRGVSVGSMIVLNPNNPLDDHDKLGHTREGLFQQFIKFGQEFLDRRQVLVLDDSTAAAVDTLIEPLSCVVAAQGRIKDRIAGKNVLVVGAGIMGLLFVLMNIKCGARNVFLANRSKEKLDYAVATGIVQQGKTFVIGTSVSSQLDQVSSGEGADIVIICVSMGQGVHAARDAVDYVNADGCVYLFAGFRAGDILSFDGGGKVDITSIRSEWKTELIQKAGKQVYLSGHRGSGYEDLAMAASLIRRDSPSFSRIISHVISLETLPEILQTVARGGNILGQAVKRVVVDMNSRDRVVELAEALPLRHLHEATRKRKDAIPRGNLFRELGFDGNTSLLGWVCPPVWQQIKVLLEAALQTTALTSKRHYIFCGTGGWVFLVDALKKVVPTTQGIAIYTLNSLDPQALENLFQQIEDLSTAVCLGISQSGRTLETVMLMDAMRERFNNAGLKYREHFIWLTNTCESVPNGESGEAAIRTSKEHEWKDVEILPLTVTSHADINALFCAPHSGVAFLTLVLLLRKEIQAVWHVYQQYLTLREEVVNFILPQANAVASKHIEHMQFNLDESIAPAVLRLVTQLVAQALGSKEVGFNPRVRVASCGQSAAARFEVISLPMPPETPATVKILLTMNALAVFVAAVAFHRRITFVTHPKVDLYKHKAVELMAAAKVEHKIRAFGQISAEIVAYLNSNPRIRLIEAICYGSLSLTHQQDVGDWIASFSPSIPIEVSQGEEWSHSLYQAAIQNEDNLYVILVSHNSCSEVEGISAKTLDRNARMLHAIARATYETLGTKALCFGVDKVFLEVISRSRRERGTIAFDVCN